MLKIGDRINVRDRSYGFGIQNGKFVFVIPMKNLVIVEIGLRVTRNAFGKTEGTFSELCDLFITDEIGGFYFIPSQDCELINKEIEIRYFSDGEDITDKISDETKRNLKALD